MKRRFRIDDNLADPGGAPLALIDDSDQVVRVGKRAKVLIEVAFDRLGAEEVAHGDHVYTPAESET